MGLERAAGGMLRVALLVVFAGLNSFGGSGSASASAPAAAPQYLALGDSITFGSVVTPPGGDDDQWYARADNFVGYPTYFAAATGLHEVNPSCPGETSESMVTAGVSTNCSWYRSSYPLHAEYGGSQLQFARSFLRAHPDTRLVTIEIGINDVGQVVAGCGGWDQAGCIDAGLPSVLDTVRANLDVTITALRETGYAGTIMLVDYYALDYSNPQSTGVIRQLDTTIDGVAATDQLPFADNFTAFMNAAAVWSGDTCAAGLFGPGASWMGPCDLHPNAAGQRLMATAMEAGLAR